MHTSKRIIGSSGKEFAGKKVCLCITGSVAAARSMDLARELMRHGAEVFCVMSDAAQKLVGSELMHWATGNQVVTKLTGECEHVTLCGEHPEKVDLVLVAPCTANTIGKIACGIDDTAVTTVVSTALGSRIPVILVPAMHASIYLNPFVSENITRLKRNGVIVAAPRIEGGKAKLPSIPEVVDVCIRGVSKQSMKGKTVLVTAGATREFIDDIRFISNPGSGRMGLAIAREAWLRGAEVALVAGHMEVSVPGYLNLVKTESVREMHEAVKKRAASCDAVVLAASVGDFILGKKAGKISSAKELKLDLSPAPKISDGVRQWAPKAKLVLFKAESNLSDAELARKAREKIRECDADLIVANDVAREGAGFGTYNNEVLIIEKNGKASKVKAAKTEIAEKIVSLIS